uniref:Tail protein n=1 Tax=viral metagenome TaxID=1070528 RepID=A0A6M3J1Z3_9ZZZZ
MAIGLESRNCVDYATLAVSSTAVGLDSASPTLTAGHTVKRAIITVETDSVRFRMDGTDPTGSEGQLLYKDDVLDFTDANYESVLKAIKFIRVTTDAALKIHYLD